MANVFKFVKWKRGVLGIQRFLEAWHSDSTHIKITPETFIEKEWYDYDTYMELLRVGDQTVGTGDLSKIYEIGYWNIKNLGHLSYLAMAPDIHDFLKGGVDNWSSVYDFGGVEVDNPQPKKLIIKYTGFPETPEKCQYFKGSLTGMMEICGLKGTVEVSKCNTKGDDCCEFVLAW